MLNPKDPKKLWKAIKYLNKSKPSIPTLSQGTHVAYTDSDKANLLNSFFGSCFNTSHPPIELGILPSVSYPKNCFALNLKSMISSHCWTWNFY